MAQSARESDRPQILLMLAIETIQPIGGPAPSGPPSLRLHDNVRWVERQTIARALEAAGGVKKDAATILGISQRALSYYLAKLARRREP